MTRWMDFPERANPDYLRARELGNSYNDWLAPGDDDTPHELLATAYWAHDAVLMAEIADATGRAGEAAGYRALLAKLRSAFIDAFVAADGQVASGTQTAYVLALHMDLVPDDLRAAAAERLVAAIRAASWHLTTGFAGVPAAAAAAPRRVTGLGSRLLRIRPGHDQGRLETGPRPVHVLGGAAAQRHGHHPDTQPARRRGPRRRG